MVLAKLGYVGIEGINLVPIKRRPGQELHEKAKADNRVFSSLRAAAESCRPRIERDLVARLDPRLSAHTHPRNANRQFCIRGKRAHISIALVKRDIQHIG